jgi:hypothetical protein
LHGKWNPRRIVARPPNRAQKTFWCSVRDSDEELVVNRTIVAVLLAACGTSSSSPPPSTAPANQADLPPQLPARERVAWKLDRSETHPPDISLVVAGKTIKVGRVSEDAEGDDCTASGSWIMCGSNRGYETFTIDIVGFDLVVTKREGMLSEGDGIIEGAAEEVARVPAPAKAVDVAALDGHVDQTVRTGMKILCRAPQEVPSDARRTERRVQVEALVAAQVTNAEVRELWKRMGTLSGADKRAALVTALGRVQLAKCRLLDEMPGLAQVPCSAEVVPPTCPEGYEHGCLDDRTAVQVCVPMRARATIPCAKGPALTCAGGERDSCTAQPAYGNAHVCVLDGAW